MGVAGRFLRGLLTREGFNVNELAFINSANCYPSVTHTPTKEHVERCRVHLVAQLNAVQPRYLLIVGGTALSATIGNHLTLKLARGKPLWLERLDPWPALSQPIMGFVSYHPAARSPTQRLQLADDVATFAGWVEDGGGYPGNCVKCGEEVESWDEYGYAWCAKHMGKQLELI